MDIDGSMLARAKEAERKLAGEEMAEKRKELGELAELPPGHPLLIQFQQAKLRHEEKEKIVQEQGQRQLKKARKIGESQERRRTAEETEKTEKLIKVSKELNAKMGSFIRSTEDMLGYVEGVQNEFKEKPFMQSKIKRLQRLLMAVRKGLDDSFIKPHFLR